MRGFVILLIALFWNMSWGKELSLIYDNNQGVSLFLMNKKLEAYETFMGLTANDPDDLDVQFNLASSLQALGEEEKALKLYSTLLRKIEKQLLSSPQENVPALQRIRFASFYNSGVAHQVMHQIPEALANYQQALALVPQSQEIKVNIEMMFAGGQGKGKGDNKDKKDKSDGQGDSENQDQDQQQNEDQEQEKNQDQKQQPKDDKKDQNKEKQKKQFDQKYMSNEDLKRIMEELKEQEQKIRAKMERQGGKSAAKDKEW